MIETIDPRSCVLGALRRQGRAISGPLRTLDSIVAVVMRPRGGVRCECDTLEASGLINASRGTRSDGNPFYYITEQGEEYLNVLDYQAAHQLSNPPMSGGQPELSS